MRILVVGAGAVGGYFGGRLLAAGRDVTFLVRPKRAAELGSRGLSVRSKLGDLDLASPRTITADVLREPFDVVLLSCKAYDLDSAMESFTPAVGPATVILPVLNGMRHLDALDARFGVARVLGGLVLISSALDAEGRIQHFNDLHVVTFGERDGASSERANRIAAEWSDCGFEVRLTETILQEMWEKWIFIATMASATCLMRAATGDIVAAGGTEVSTRLLDECAAIAADNGFPPREASIERSRGICIAPDQFLMASMLRDIERGGHTEGEHMLGDLLNRRKGSDAHLLEIGWLHVKAYEARRARESR